MREIINKIKKVFNQILSINLAGIIIILILVGLLTYQQIHFNKVIDRNEKQSHNYLSELENRFSDVESAMSDLRSEVDDFDYEDWRTNAGEVQDATDELESQNSHFGSSINDYFSYPRYRRLDNSVNAI